MTPEPQDNDETCKLARNQTRRDLLNLTYESRLRNQHTDEGMGSDKEMP